LALALLPPLFAAFAPDSDEADEDVVDDGGVEPELPTIDSALPARMRRCRLL